MKSETIPVRGPGRFQWNSGGWFGSVIGCTCWLLTGVMVFATEAPSVALLWGCCFFVPFGLGIVLWMLRGRTAPYPALQVQLLVTGLTTVIAITPLFFRTELLEKMNCTRTQLVMILFLFPALMLWFHFLEQQRRGPNV